MAAASLQGGPQGMSAVLGLDETEVAGVLASCQKAGEVLTVANLNAPGQVVISGHQPALVRAAEELRRAGAKRVMSLSVGGAFHSALMESASQDLNSAIDGAPLTVGKAQAFNVDGRLRTEPDEVRDALKRQLSAPVRWVDCVRSLLAVGVSRFIEVGPGGTLSAMGRRISSDAQWVPVNDIAGASQLTLATV